MNLSFLKLRVADCPWILFDRLSAPGGDRGAVDLPWESIAVDICSRSRGAAGSGIVVVEREGDTSIVRTWDAEGASCIPPPAAALCASRLLFDAGRAGSESIVFRSSGGDTEVLVIDSRTLGIPVGIPARADGAVLAGVWGPDGPGLSVRPGSGVALPVRLYGHAVEVALYARPPARSSSRAGPGHGAGRAVAPGFKRVEVLAVSRQELRVRRGVCDPIVAAAAASAAAVVADYADRETACLLAGDRLVVQWPEAGPLFVAAAPEYCLSGEFWLTEV